MLYQQIRYAVEIRKLYKIRHLLIRRRHPAIDSLLGFSKSSMQFYRIKKTLRTEGVLDREGKFIENTPNLWMAELALQASREQTKTLGHEVPYSMFLAAVLQPPTGITTRELSGDLHIARQTIHYALKELQSARVLKSAGRGKVTVEEKLRDWMLRYLDIAKSFVDTTGETFYLFNMIPSHIGGAAARYVVKYEPGRPLGPSDMKIETYKPFLAVWESLIRDVRYFREYPRKVELDLAKPDEKIIRIGGIPYHAAK